MAKTKMLAKIAKAAIRSGKKLVKKSGKKCVKKCVTSACKAAKGCATCCD